VPEYRFGDIVDVDNVYDPNRQNPKNRPVLIISTNADIAASDDLVGVAVSSKNIPPKPAKLPADFIELPFADGGYCKTGLNKRSVAKCRWLVRFNKAQITGKRGGAPGPQVELVMRYLQSQT
jgi:hypothetical protein